MYYGNNFPDIFSLPESTRIRAHTEYNYYFNKFNLCKIFDGYIFCHQDQVANLVKIFPGENYLLCGS